MTAQMDAQMPHKCTNALHTHTPLMGGVCALVHVCIELCSSAINLIEVFCTTVTKTLVMVSNGRKASTPSPSRPFFRGHKNSPPAGCSRLRQAQQPSPSSRGCWC
jgi:hypothetical protein